MNQFLTTEANLTAVFKENTKMTLTKIVKDLINSYRGKDKDRIYAFCTERLRHMGLNWDEYKEAIQLLNDNLESEGVQHDTGRNPRC